jgi:hypothetical protein
MSFLALRESTALNAPHSPATASEPAIFPQGTKARSVDLPGRIEAPGAPAANREMNEAAATRTTPVAEISSGAGAIAVPCVLPSAEFPGK